MTRNPFDDLQEGGISTILDIPYTEKSDPTPQTGTAGSIFSDNIEIVLPTPAVADADETESFWKQTQRFFYTGNRDKLSQYQITSKYSSPLLFDIQDMTRVSHDYPLWIANGETLETAKIASPFSTLLKEALKIITSDKNSAKILKENIDRIETLVRKSVFRKKKPTDFEKCIQKTIKDIRKELSLPEEEAAVFEQDLENLVNQLPKGGLLVDINNETLFYILNAFITNSIPERNSNLKRKISELIGKLKDLIQLEKSKNNEAKKPNAISGSLGTASTYIDADIMSTLIPDSASEQMPLERFHRIEKVIAILQDFFSKQPNEKSETVVILPEYWKKEYKINPGNILKTAETIVVEDDNRVETTYKTINKVYNSYSDLITAIRIAELEVKGQYQTEIHDTLFEAYDWNFYDEADLSILPQIFILEDELKLLEIGMSAFSPLMVSTKPANILIIRNHSSAENEYSTGGKRQEIGFQAVSHRKAYVSQNTTNRPDHLVECLKTGVNLSTPACFYILSVPAKINNPFLWSACAIESREFPLFSYNPLISEWGNRFCLKENPEYQELSPRYHLQVIDDNQVRKTLDLTFTYLDFIVQDTAFKKQFHIIPGQFWNENMITVSEFLEIAPEKRIEKIPYIWLLDSEGELVKVMPTYSLIQICQEKMDYWKTLQDQSGVNSYHANRAREKVRLAASRDLELKLAEAKDDFEKELEKIRQETAGKTMEKLSSVLLDLDVDSILPIEGSTYAKVRSPEAEKEETPEVQEIKKESPEAEDELIIDELWVETFKCTSCNECININSTAFKYNSDKQMILGDTSKISFAQIVQAAEKCPARCIHPGTPLDPNEAHIDDLIKRAADFN